MRLASCWTDTGRFLIVRSKNRSYSSVRVGLSHVASALDPWRGGLGSQRVCHITPDSRSRLRSFPTRFALRLMWPYRNEQLGRYADTALGASPPSAAS